MIALMLAGGTVVRLVFFMGVGVTANYADNLSGISLGLDRFLQGSSPYTMLEYGTHTNPMGYLPWTIFAYIPPKMLGLDLRLTNVVLSLAVLGVTWAFLRALPLSPALRNGVMLVAAAYFLIPKNIGHDAFTEFQMFDLAVVTAFCLAVLQRGRLAALAAGVALGSMPIAVYFAPALIGFTLRTVPIRKSLELGLIAGLVAGVPILWFALWDWPAFLQTTTLLPADSWALLSRAQGDLSVVVPQYALWHSILGANLRYVEGLVVGAALRWSKTPRHLVGLGLGSYLALVLFGPLVESHMLQLVLYLAVILAGLRLSQSRTLVGA
jgi:hypothetical protein